VWSDLLGGDEHSLSAFQQHMRENGWAFVELDEEITTLIKAATPHLERFFQEPLESKVQFSENLLGGKELDGAVYGYNNSVPRREGLRLLTGSRSKDKWIPPQCSELRPLMKMLDAAMIQLCQMVCPYLFHKTAEQIGSSWSVPLLTPFPQSKGEGQFAMMDVAYYHNNNLEIVNCAEHVDPGLFSLSVLSTQPGLQLKHISSGEWVDAPTNFGQGRTAVVWGGILLETISNGQLKAGFHRVTDPKGGPPRMSIWTECCTSAQDLSVSVPILQRVPGRSRDSPPPRLTSKGENTRGIIWKKQPNLFDDFFKKSRLSGVPITKQKFDMSKQRLNKKPLKNKRVNSPSKPPMSMIEVEKGESITKALMKHSMEYGVPMTKLITHYCPFCVRPVHNLLSHVEAEHPGSVRQVEPPGETQSSE